MLFDEASNEKSLYRFDTGTIARVTTLFRLCLAAYASSGFAPMKERFHFFQRLKSLSDVTVAPVAPTVVSAHRSQNELHWDMADASHRPASLCKLFSRLLFLLKRIWLMDLCSFFEDVLIIFEVESDCKHKIRIV